MSSPEANDMSNIYENLEKIENREDIVRFISSLVDDLKNNSKDWANISLGDYLNGMASWIEDMDGLYPESEREQLEQLDWKLVAMILYSGSRYE
ncbi:hypothetical protein [Paenibacillus xylanexedens]|uniref:DUF7660 family protein n=1 Tax=Paenibacillus xylanexedens TaxID=528191 RepID=UPI0021B634E0|nr:hypothetical protein [Paenibacillus xylanexedens]